MTRYWNDILFFYRLLRISFTFLLYLIFFYRPGCPSSLFHTWETLLQEVEIDSQALGDIASILGRQVSRPLLEKSFFRKIQSRKVFTHRESYETIIAKTEEKLAKVIKERIVFFYVIVILCFYFFTRNGFFCFFFSADKNTRVRIYRIWLLLRRVRLVIILILITRMFNNYMQQMAC